jgi:hypothetical protein
MFFLGEVTSPVLNLFTLAKELRHTSKAAARLFRVMSPVFTGARGGRAGLGCRAGRQRGAARVERTQDYS